MDTSVYELATHRCLTCSVACSASRVLLLPVLPITLICRPNWFTAGEEASCVFSAAFVSARVSVE